MKVSATRVFLVVATIAVVAWIAWLLWPSRAERPDHDVSTGESTLVRVGYLPSLAASQLYVGIAKGFFVEEGLRVEIQEIYSGPEIVDALQSRAVDVAFGIVPPLVLSRARGIPIKSIGGATIDSEEVQDHRLLVAKGSSIKSATDLRGKKIAVVAEPTSDGLALLDYLETHGIRANEVELVKTPHPEQVFAVASGAVDAAASIEPFITIGVLGGRVEVLDFYYSNAPTEVGTYLVHEDTIEVRPDMVRRFARVIERATSVCERPDELRQLLPTLSDQGIPFKVSEQVSQKMNVMGFRASLTISGIRKVMDQLLKHGFMEEPIDVEACLYSHQ